jgi:hypothetical protein
MNKAFLGAAITTLAISVTVGRCFFAAPAPDGEPLPVVVNVTPARQPSTPTAQPTLQPISGALVRVNFTAGSYGETLAADDSTAYLLWAKAGQVFTTTLTADTSALASLYAPDGGALFDNVRGGDLEAVTLPTDGDYRLEIRSSGRYTAGVMIR